MLRAAKLLEAICARSAAIPGRLVRNVPRRGLPVQGWAKDCFGMAGTSPVPVLR